MNTVNAKCPYCYAQLKAPVEYVGRRVKCLQCKNTFRLGNDNTPAKSDVYPPSENSPHVADSGNTRLREKIEHRGPSHPHLETKSAVQSLETQVSDNKVKSVPTRSKALTRSHGLDGYPNLVKLLRLSASLCFIALIVTVLCGTTFVLVGLFRYYTNHDLVGGFAAGTSVLTGLLSMCVGYLVYMILLAGIELAWVIIDIEANTRPNHMEV